MPSSPHQQQKRAYHIMTKPIGPLCNLDCTYCFYLEKAKLYPDQNDWKMKDDVLERYVQAYIESQQVPEVNFAWQGGEPTLMGVDFFRRAVALQKKYANGKHITNAFQTNGTKLDDEWGQFLHENEFLVGISIDGPREMHDFYRVDKGGQPSFDDVMRGLEALKRNEVEFNTLTVVQRNNSYHPLEVYRFLKEIGSGFIQFIPIAERLEDDKSENALDLCSPVNQEKQIASHWSVESLQYGKFLTAIFDEWIRKDVGKVYVQIFDTALEAWMGMNPSLCVFSETCGKGLAMEHNGDLYSCDHYVYPEYHLGNIMDKPIDEMVDSLQQRKFGTDKRDSLPKMCRECDVLFVCHGECPKNRFISTPDGEPGLNYLCDGLYHFFKYIDAPMRYMANELRAQRSPANVMHYMRQRDLMMAGKSEPAPNDPCHCGSGKKFKKCHGGKVAALKG